MAKPLSGTDVGRRLCEDLLTPEFFEKYWEKQPLHVRAAERDRPVNLLPEALSVDDVVTLLQVCGPNLKMFKSGSPVDIDNFMVGYLEGASLIVNQADRCNTTLYQLSRVLAQMHFHHVFGVVYLTPADSQAVRLHNDDQDVFLLQVWGKKRWTIRPAPQLLIYTEEMLGKEEPVPENLVGEPVMEFTIEPGDVLYMPRGYLHEATTGTEPSLHITITVPSSDYCWGVQLVKHLLQEMHTDKLPSAPSLRGSMCNRSSKGEDSPFDKDLSKVIGTWADKLSPERVLETFQQRMARTNEGQERQYAHIAQAKTGPCVTEHCRVRLMYGVHAEVYEDMEYAVFRRSTDGQELEMPIGKTAVPLIHSLTSRPQRVRDLPGEDAFERICVLQMLVQSGVLQVFLKGEDEE